ncbi:allophanate hydrolase subunit 2-domain-containing protein [Phellopilus nigrolimitatus]|nr:allophanate hydrolase subunit 2-domain-containing protein [Phellopilus nigrolimitatus]
MSLEEHKLLVANRGEIAVRILRTAKRLGVRTVSVYTEADATAPHVLLADEAVPLNTPASDEERTANENAKAYLNASAIVRICIERSVTIVHPGYGFLSENAQFAMLLAESGITLLGPSVSVIEEMGLKHRARALAIKVEVPVVPGSDGLIANLEEAEHVAEEIGYPVMLKATAGGGGMGMVVCRDVGQLRTNVLSTQQRAKTLFHNDGIFLEKFFDSSRHIEVQQIFGNGLDHVIHMGERECSVQRRHQKIIEEAPSPFLIERQDLRKNIYDAAVRLGKLINYSSAGTVEFLVDDKTGKFYFLEMNTRLQVEHGVTETLYSGLDIVELMIRQGGCERTKIPNEVRGLSPALLDQERFLLPPTDVHAIEVRVYCENPATGFSPSPGLLQHVEFPLENEDIRVDSWVSTGMVVSPFYDPLVAKIVVKGTTREDAIDKLATVLSEDVFENEKSKKDRFVIKGTPNNIPFIQKVLQESVFRRGHATTEWVDNGGVSYVPSAFTVLSPGINATVQSLPVRDIGLGIPLSGPMDQLAFQAGNAIVGNTLDCEGLELVIPPSTSGVKGGSMFTAIFHVQAAVAVTGAPASVLIDGREVSMWSKIIVPAGSKLTGSGGGLRAYISILGGFPGIPTYLGSKSTSMGLGGYQGRALQTSDVLQIRSSISSAHVLSPLPQRLIPKYPSQWILFSLPGPHDDIEYLTSAGIEAFYRRDWKVSSASNRMGVRLEPPDSLSSDRDQPILEWARQNGGEGGSHPSNILDNGYARGSVNLNGDTPVILTNEGPSMGGYLCISTIATADQWKIGQLRPGDSVRFERISYGDAFRLQELCDKWLETVIAISSGFNASPFDLLKFSPEGQALRDPKLHTIPALPGKPKVVFRQAGDSAILVEYGHMELDFSIRAHIHAFETSARKLGFAGIKEFAPCIRSTMVHYDTMQIRQAELLSILIDVEESLPSSLEDAKFSARKLTFPIVLDDKWNKEALLRYMKSTRENAVYLPSNIEYLARNNGVEGGAEEALRLLVSSSWLVFGVGFYLACPFLVPIDPRCRLVSQKMNPSRTYTPRGAVGIAGLIAAIYPVESPGGYQLFGRTWQAWGKGLNFASDRPWLLEPFDQAIMKIEKEFDSGRYSFKIEPVTFSMEDYVHLVASMRDEITAFKRRQEHGVASEEAREQILLKEWKEKEESKGSAIDMQVGDTDDFETQNYITASLSGSVWQVKTRIGDLVNSAEEVLVVLEAMKTEIAVSAGEENVGLRVSGFGKGMKEGKVVQAGDKLVFFAD